MKRFIVFLGAPGSGKGTQSQLLSQDLTIPHISMGDLVRHEIKIGSPVGLKVKDYSSKGQLVPDSVIFELFDSSVGSSYLKSGFILDGFPRTGVQAEFIVTFFKKHHINLETDVVIIYLDVPIDLIKKRILGRRSCPECGTLYNVFFSPPKTDNYCDKCHHHGLSIREDDTEEIIDTRFSEFSKTNQQVLNVFGPLVSTIDGSVSSSDVYSAIRSHT